MLIQEVDVQNHEDFDGHEKVMCCRDEKSGLLAYIAIHNRNLGPALGGCRMWPYETEADAITDVLRLSRGMTYKSAVANLPLGGGKAVIVGDPKTMKNEQLLRQMGKFVGSLQGAYITAEDSGTSVADLETISRETQFVAGVRSKQHSDGTETSGDPSPSTAYGVFVGINASVQHRFGTTGLRDVKVAGQGVGNVGRNLVKMLVEAGAVVYVSDNFTPALDAVQNESQVTVVDNRDIHTLDVEVFSPCALGGALNMDALVAMRAPIVAGAANNQLANAGSGEYLYHKGIVYAPDYVINSGGIIDIFYERKSCEQKGFAHNEMMNHIKGIGDTLTNIYMMSHKHQVGTHLMADKIAESRFLDRAIGEVA